MTTSLIPNPVDPATILEKLCAEQAKVCNEFTRTTNNEVFERVVTLVNEIADGGRRNHPETLEQAVYKIALLAQAQSPDCSRETKRLYSIVWTQVAFRFRGFYVSKAGHERRMARMRKLSGGTSSLSDRCQVDQTDAAEHSLRAPDVLREQLEI